MPIVDATTTLEDVFTRLRERRFVFVEPTGNWGDHLIYAGAEHLADRVGLHRIDVSAKDLVAGVASGITAQDVIYVHGNGAYNAFGSGSVYGILSAALSTHRGTVIQGPCTASTQPETVGKIQHAFGTIVYEAVWFFAREQTTFGWMPDVLPAEVMLARDHDTALQLKRDDLIKLSGLSAARYDLVVVREDNESTDDEAWPQRNEVSLDPAYFATSFGHWLRIHCAARSILSNRTHTAIAGAILQIPTQIYGGSYHKNRSIWEYSLQSMGVKWGEPSREGRTEPGVGLRERLPGFLRNSWKVDRMLWRLKGVPLR